MAALTQDRNTERRGAVVRKRNMKVAATTTIYAGSIVAVDGTGYLIPGDDAAGITTVGVALEQVDNSAGGDGDLECEVGIGVFLFDTTGANAVTQADVGLDNACILDDQTVVVAAGVSNNIVAGRVEEIKSATEVWVAIGLY